MPTAVGEPQQNKQPSRKGKRAWRKNVDITTVQQGLESLREEIRHGGPIAEKSSEDLFVVDTNASPDIKKKHKLTKPLKVDQILAERSAVPAVDSRKRPHSKLGDGIFEPASKRQRKDWVSKKEVARLKSNLNKRSHLDTEQIEDAGAGFDLWEQTPGHISTATTAKQDEYIPKPRAKVPPPTIRRPPTAMTSSGKAVRAVQNPDAGTSYNPSFEAWDDLLTREGTKEVALEQARQQQAQADAEREARIAAIVAANDEREGQSDYESAWEGFETENDQDTLKKKRPVRKTPAQRNKLKRRKEAERLAKHEEAMEKRDQKAQQALMSLIKLNDTLDPAPAPADPPPPPPSSSSSSQSLRRRKLGNTTIPAQPLELVLPDELQDSLRRLKPEGNLMADRFRNVLVNGKLEARRPVPQARRKRVKVTEKWSYKDFGIEV